MPVPSTIDELDPLSGNNYPSGSESPSTIDNYLRAHAAFIAQMRDGLGPILTGSENTAADIRTLLDVFSKSESAEPVGVMKQYAGATAPSGWLLCNGAAVSRTTYAALFAAIGTAFGAGDGTTTFNLPNTQNRVLVGAGGLYARGATGGSKDAIVVAHTHTGATSSAGAHTHGISSSGESGTTGDFIAGAGFTNRTIQTQGVGDHIHTFTTNSTGSSGTDANMPPYLAVNMIIKV